MPLNIDDLQKQFSISDVKEELQKRVEAIDNGTEVVTPYMDGMDEMLQRIKSKYNK
jgi:hypothetical protein